MKKILTIVAVAMFSLVMVACQSDVDKAKELIDKTVQAIERGDNESADRYIVEYEQLYNTLSAKEKAEADEYELPYASLIFEYCLGTMSDYELENFLKDTEDIWEEVDDYEW